MSINERFRNVLRGLKNRFSATRGPKPPRATLERKPDGRGGRVAATELIHDDPITSPDEDLLDAASVAKRLARVVADWPGEQSLVVGIFAPWGIGKTSTIRLLEHYLREPPFNDRVTVVRFNPWLYRDADALLRSFFATLREATGNTRLLSVEGAKDLASALDAIGSVVGAAGAAIASHHGGDAAAAAASVKSTVAVGRAYLTSGEVTLEVERERARTVLRRLADREPPARLVMLIDDLDRAEQGEVRMMLRLIRVVADFPAITYVCAADFDRTARIVAQDGGEDGKQYLEKIFQVSVPLTGASRSRIQSLVASGIDDMFAGTPASPAGGIEAAFERRRLELRTTLMWRIQSLRDRARLLNAIRLLLLSGDDALEVDPVDACLVSLLSTFYPSLIERLRRNEEFLLGTGSFRSLLRTSGGKDKEHADARARTLGSIIYGEARVVEESDRDPEDVGVHSLGDRTPVSRVLEEHALLEVIRALFPNVLSAGGVSGDEQVGYRLQNRICSPSRFERYFLFGRRPEEVSDQSTDRLLEEAGSPAGGDDAAMLVRQSLVNISATQRSDLFERILDRRGRLTASTSKAIAESVGSIAMEGDLAADEALRFLVRLANYRTEGKTDFDRSPEDLARAEAAANAIRNLVETSGETWEAVWLAGEAMRAMVSNLITDTGRMRPNAGNDAPSWLRAIAASGKERARRHIQSGRDPFAALPIRDFSDVFWRWRDILWIDGEDLSALRDYLSDASNTQGRLPQILAAFFNYSPAGPTDPKSPADLRLLLGQVWNEKEAISKARAAAESPSIDDPHSVVKRFVAILEGGAMVGSP
jgi:hypothetical protein